MSDNFLSITETTEHCAKKHEEETHQNGINAETLKNILDNFMYLDETEIYLQTSSERIVKPLKCIDVKFLEKNGRAVLFFKA